MSVKFCSVSCHVKICRNVSLFIAYCASTSFHLTFFAVEPEQIVIGLTQSHIADVRSRGAISQHLGAISQHLKPQHLALLDS